MIRTVLDAIGILLVAAGVAALAYPWMGWGCLAVAGVLLLAGSFLSAVLERRVP